MIFSTIGSILSGIGAGAGTAAAGAGAAAGAAGAAGGFAPTLTAISGAVGTGISAVGAVMQHQGAKRAEALRQRQMNLEARRARVNTVRQAIVARAQALQGAEAQGAGTGSGILGGISQISAQSASNQQGVNQGQEIGNKMFSANRMISTGQTLASIGGAFNDISNMFAQNYDTNYRVFGF